MTTVEQLDYAQLWVVSESRSIFEPFLRDKLFLSLYDSLKHRKTAISDSLGLTASIIAKLSGHNNGQISKKQLIETSLTVLKHFDKVAAIHYQAYYGQLN